MERERLLSDKQRIRKTEAQEDEDPRWFRQPGSREEQMQAAVSGQMRSKQKIFLL